jgi:hypothetical protein
VSEAIGWGGMGAIGASGAVDMAEETLSGSLFSNGAGGIAAVVGAVGDAERGGGTAWLALSFSGSGASRCGIPV